MTSKLLIWPLRVFAAGALLLPLSYMAAIEVGAHKGIPEAQNEIGRWYDQGVWLHASDQREAEIWYLKAAEHHYAKAQYNLGLLMEAQKNYQRAAYWYQRAAIQNFPPAQNNLAVMYAKGAGGSRDIQQAKFWYEKAAQNGNEKAQYSLGIAYANGEGVGVDHSKAAFWISQSAKQGFAPAQGYLAILYAQGLGVKEDLNEALAWAKKAQANHDKHAAETIKLIEQLKSH